MQYYVSWTHSDPIYHQYISNLPVLVSPPNVNRVWQVTKWPLLPPALIVDSGAFQHTKAHRAPEPAAVLARQLEMVAEAEIPVGLCHLDIPMVGARLLGELDHRVEQSLANARWLMDYVAAAPLPPNVTPIGVIQGYHCEKVYHVATALADMGYTSFALGSLAAMVASARDELLRRVEAALESVGPNVHVLGVSSVTLLDDIARLGIRSADSAAPMREAWHGGIWYSRPFRRYKIPSAHFREWRRSYSFSEILLAPLPCGCPVCLEDPARLLEPQGKSYVNLRALHNCYHLARQVSGPAEMQ